MKAALDPVREPSVLTPTPFGAPHLFNDDWISLDMILRQEICGLSFHENDVI